MRTLGSVLLASALMLTLGNPTAGAAPASAEYTYAVIGDVPYGNEQVELFPQWIDQIDADVSVGMTFHLGDIKNGSSTCTNEYFDTIRSDFDQFDKPFIYTPGDNEWTDCHRANNGAYNPLERLAQIRRTFFDRPGSTLGRESMPVSSQAMVGLPENVSLTSHGVAMATLHVVGSNDGLQPWAGIGRTDTGVDQRVDEAHRMLGAIAQVHTTFAGAALRGDRAVALYTQADMFDPGVPATEDYYSAFRPLIQAIALDSALFGKPVYLFNGDSHKFNVDNPLAAGSSWLSFYGATAANNLTRVTVDGSENNKDYLRVDINRPGSGADVLTWERVPFTVQSSS